MIMEGLAHHAARELPKAFPGVAVVAASSMLSLPWQQIGWISGALLLWVQTAYSIWKWRKESRDKQNLKATVPAPNDSGQGERQ